MPGKRKKPRKAVNRLSSGSSSDTSPKHEAKQNTLEGETSPSTMAVQNEQDEMCPSPVVMWKALMQIETNMNSVINDLKVMQHNYNELRASLKFSQAKIEELTKNNSVLQTKMKETEKNNSALKEEMSKMNANLQESIQKNTSQIEEISTKHDDLEQFTRKYHLEIDGIPQVEDENPVKIVIKLAQCMDVDLRPEDIDIVHRFKKGSRQHKPIIVRFSNYYSKDEMYRGRRKLRKVNVQHISGAEKIYINENLTACRAALFKKVRDKKTIT